jgi:hypothetical protein
MQPTNDRDFAPFDIGSFLYPVPWYLANAKPKLVVDHSAWIIPENGD